MVSNFAVSIVHQLFELLYAKVTDIGEIKRIYFFVSVKAIATSNVFSNARGKFNFANDSVLFTALLISRAER